MSAHAPAQPECVPDESAAHLYGRARIAPFRTGLPFLDRPLGEGLPAGEMLEVFGRSQTGKTEVLYQAALSCALPRRFEGLGLGGLGAHCVFVDLDFRFSTLRLLALLEHRVRAAFRAAPHTLSRGSSASSASSCPSSSPPAPPPPGDEDAFVASDAFDRLRNETFARVLVVRCETETQVLATLRTIGDEGAPGWTEEGQPRLLLVDNVAAFYWTLKSQNGLSFYHRLASTLAACMKRCRLSAIVTKPLLFGGYPHREYLGQRWGALVAHRATLEEVAPPDQQLKQQQQQQQLFAPRRRHVCRFAGRRCQQQQAAFFTISAAGLH